MSKINLSLLLFACFVIPSVSAAHWVVGEVQGNANGLPVYLYNPLIGQNYNISDIIGATGASGVDNIYMIDVEMLYSCSIGDEVILTIDGLHYVPVTITGAGYDVAPTLYYNVSAVVPVNVTMTSSQNNTNVTITPTPVTNTTVSKNTTTTTKPGTPKKKR